MKALKERECSDFLGLLKSSAKIFRHDDEGVPQDNIEKNIDRL